MIDLAALLPPRNVLNHVQGVEQGLRRSDRLSHLGKAGALVSAVAQVVLVVVYSGSFSWELLLPLVAFVVFGALVGWTRFWLKESREAFRYTFSLGKLEPVTESDGEELAWLGSWLQHDLSQRLNDRIRRLSLLDEQRAAERGEDEATHIHITASFGMRPAEQRSRHAAVIEVVPRVRIGKSSEAQTIGHAERLEVDRGLLPGADGRPREERATATSPRATRSDGNHPHHEGGFQGLGPPWYEDLLERLHFSVASEIYRQVHDDVDRKIELLPTNFLKATALLREADDYARSRTLEAYEDALELYSRATAAFSRRLASPWDVVRRLQRNQSQPFRPVHALLQRNPTERSPRRWRPKRELYQAEAEMGHATMLIYRRTLAALSGQRINPYFEALPVARDALDRLRRLPRARRWRSWLGRHDDEFDERRNKALFDAHVSLALVSGSVGDRASAERCLDAARHQDPNRAEDDAGFVHATGEITPGLVERIRLHGRAVELDEAFEAARFGLAIATESLWRTRPELEPGVAPLALEEYEKIVKRNPGLIGAWANIGYIRWLLAGATDHYARGLADDAAEAFKSGRKYKEIKHVTFVGELDYGLARVAAERGGLEDADDECARWATEEAYKYYIRAVSAQIAEDSPGFGTYYFELMGEAVLRRFELYRDRAFTTLERAKPLVSERVRNSVRAFILNDYGEACFALSRRWLPDEADLLDEAEEALTEATRNNPDYVMPLLNLGWLRYWRGDLEGAKRYYKKVTDLEPKWVVGLQEQASIHVDSAIHKAKESESLATKVGAESARLEEGKKRLARMRERLIRPEAEGELVDEVQVQQLVDELDGLERQISELGDRAGTLRGQGEELARESVSLVKELFRRRGLVADRDFHAMSEGSEHAVSTDRADVDGGIGTGSDATVSRVDALLGRGGREELRYMSDADMQALVVYAKHLSVQGDPRQLLRAVRACNAILAYHTDDQLLGQLRFVAEALQRRVTDVDSLRWELAARDGALAGLGVGEVPTWCDTRALDSLVRQVIADPANVMGSSDYVPAVPTKEQWTATGTQLRSWDALLRSVLWNAALPPSLVPFVADQLRAVEALEQTSEPTARFQWVDELAREAENTPDDDDAMAAIARAADRSGRARLHWYAARRYEVRDDLTESLGRYKAAAERCPSPNSVERRTYRGRIAVIFWKRHEYPEALEELDRFLNGAELTKDSVVGVLSDVVDEVTSITQYRELKDWLRRRLEVALSSGDGSLSEHATALRESLMKLVRAKYSVLPYGREVDPARALVTPIGVEGHSDLFPEGEGWAADHPLFIEWLPEMRERLHRDSGVEVPGVRMRARSDLPLNGYRILLWGTPVASDRLYLSALSHFDGAVSPSAGGEATDGEAVEPEDHLKRLVLCIEDVLRDHLDFFVGVDEAAMLLPYLGDEDPDVLDYLPLLAQVLRNLLRDGLPIHSGHRIGAAFSAAVAISRDPVEVSEAVRHAVVEELAPSVSRRMVLVSAQFERAVQEALVVSGNGRRFLALRPAQAERLLKEVREALQADDGSGVALVVRNPDIRGYLRRLLSDSMPRTPVLVSGELDGKVSPFSTNLSYAS